MKVLTQDNKVLTVGGKALKVVYPVMWNQLVSISQLPYTTTSYGVSIVNNNDGSILLNGTSSREVVFNFVNKNEIQSGRKYLISGGLVGYATFNIYDSVLIGGGGKANTIITAVGSGLVSSERIYIYTGQEFSSYIIHPQLFDLTLMFGSGNEPTTIVQYEEWLAENGLDGYQPYNAGELRYLTKPSWL